MSVDDDSKQQKTLACPHLATPAIQPQGFGVETFVIGAHIGCSSAKTTHNKTQ